MTAPSSHAHRTRTLFVLLGLWGLTAASGAVAGEITGIRWGRHDDYSRCVIDWRGDAIRLQTENRIADLKTLYCDLYGVTKEWAPPSAVVNDPRVTRVESLYFPRDKRLRLAIRLDEYARIEVATLGDPKRLMIDFYWGTGASSGGAATGALAPSASGLGGATPNQTSQASPTRQTGQTGPASPAIPAASASLGGPSRKPVVVIDPGHGGWHSGGVGRIGRREVREKDITMQIALRLKEKLDASGACETVMTRTKDVYVGLYDRVVFAEQKQGDLFVSIHCNATDDKAAQKRAEGLEFWYWNENGTSSAAGKRLEQIENDEGSGHQGVDSALPQARRLLRTLMADRLEAESLESRRVAKVFESAFLRREYFKRSYRGIHSARFKVCENYQMPSVLVEVGFISHPTEVKKLVDKNHQDLIAACMAEGVQRYLRENRDYSPAVRAGAAASSSQVASEN